MVYLIDFINQRKQAFDETSLATFAYYHVYDKENLASFSLETFSGLDLIAAKGYQSVTISEHDLHSINAPGYKGVDVSFTIYRLIGAYLAAPSVLESRLKQKFEETTFRNKFLISNIVPKYKPAFNLLVKSDPSKSNIVFQIIEHNIAIGISEKEAISTLLKEASDIIDLMIIEELHRKFLDQQISSTLINHISVYESIIGVLNNFHNATKKITKERRKDHELFVINDEYDVQDLVYVVLKSFFPTLKDEDPTPRVGAKSNRIDLILREEGILLEIKMLKKSDGNEKDFIEQLKIDIQSYHQCHWLKHLIFFVYDPLGKTKDVQNFYDLNGNQTINNTNFTVLVIVNPT